MSDGSTRVVGAYPMKCCGLFLEPHLKDARVEGSTPVLLMLCSACGKGAMFKVTGGGMISWSEKT